MNTRRDGPGGPRTSRPGGQRDRFRHGPPSSGPRGVSGDHVVLYGWHPVSQALANEGRGLHRLLATENALARLTEELGQLRIDAELVRPNAINALLGPDAVHQGLYLEADPLPGPDLDDLPDDALLLALDQITDPHNVGAIVRTAAAFGVAGIITTARHSPTATGVLAKSASGGLEHVPLVIVRNLSDALIDLGKRGFTRIGLDSEGEATLDSVGPKRPAVIVLGAEGKGLRQRTRDNCDVLARIPFSGEIRSINVSNAAAITLYALSVRGG
ncbi:23S rRNA (guanosine(2251)-2'-O)-methyltransferase RlmB [Methylobacterium sp. SD274]|uniref:23S rRNA (guanosine(2251)-2'-O)-methyltransferase RlmB n=1 Tax=unclassified Methylobacterium TaxID=2615210 RepID=UPI0006FB7C0D|nr:MULTISPECIES: 23S rRNA (guanosine(2251)-2'-O)-methyltransferase RlmB [unclassified Methylobacterium]KQO54473.1 RNA methyltransferase [Methylobacterium sp. Leaf86]KQO90514.1 RNA methyltransferase [Methylobacterium sp. Leaf91]MBO1018906.1 23S rRNA (guanosine(2251)-2'-O)-methyltransferase RlmB [Methylobacterium sp. SD274]